MSISRILNIFFIDIMTLNIRDLIFLDKWKKNWSLKVPKKSYRYVSISRKKTFKIQ